MAVNDSKITFHIFNQGGTTLDPIAAVHVCNTADILYFSPVNMPANDAVHLVLSGHLSHCIFVFSDILHGALGLHFEVGGKRPIIKSQASPDAVGVKIEIKNHVVKTRPHSLQNPVEPCQTVKLMTVQNQVSFAISPNVNNPLQQAHPAKLHPCKVLEKLVVIAVKESDFGMLASFAKYLLNERVVGVQPAPVALELPAVKKITNDVNEV
jgi:hypothetical protein